MAEGLFQHPSVQRVPAVIEILRQLVNTQEADTQQRNDGDGQRPGSEERDDDDLEQGGGEFSGTGFGEVDRQECGCGGQRRRQERHFQLRRRVDGRLDAPATLRHLHQDALGHDDAVVHEHAEGDDQGRERNLIEADVQLVHHQQRHQHAEGHQRGHDQPGADAEAEQHDQRHHGHRLQQVGHEAADLGLHFPRGKIHQPEIDANRIALLQAAGFCQHLFSQTDIVAALTHGYGQGQRRLPAGGDLVSAPHGRDVAEEHQRSSVRQANHRIGDILHGFEVTADLEHDALPAVINRPAGCDDVAAVQHLGQLVRRDPQLGEPGVLILHEHALVLGAEYVHLGDIGYAQVFPAGRLRDLFDLRVGETLAGDGQHGAEHVAELVVHGRSDHPLGQVRFHRLDLAPQGIPDRAHVRVAFLDVHDDDGYAAARFAGDEIQLRHLLDGFFKLVGDQLLDPRRRRAGKVGHHLRRTNREARIVGARHAVKGGQARHQQHRQDYQRGASVFQRQPRRVHGGAPAPASMSSTRRPLLSWRSKATC